MGQHLNKNCLLVIASCTLPMDFPGLVVEESLISYALLIFHLYFLSSVSLNGVPMPISLTVIILIVAIYLIASHCLPFLASQ